MKKRTRKPKTNEDPAGQLIAFAEAWRDAANRLDSQTALRARRQAEAIFKKHPDFRQKPPTPSPKSLYIDWKFFVNFLDPKHREAYLQAVKTNTWTEFHTI